MKVLLGGIPLGRDNIGDEAILAGVCSLLRRLSPGVELTVLTADQTTGRRLGVETAPLFGFFEHEGRRGLNDFVALVSRHDAYVWCGATGLSDYPHIGLALLDAAQRVGVPTFVWAVGMDDEPNPVFFRAHGRRRALLDAFGLVPAYEKRLRRRLGRRVCRILPRCRGVWTRDAASAAALARYGFAGARIAADTAILFAETAPARDAGLENSGAPTLGLCISDQRRVADMPGLRRFLDAMAGEGIRVLGIPMNPKKDRVLMEALGVECIAGDTPEAVICAAARCNAVRSSRLHLLILAACAGTPGLGISRGSKIANWLSEFGQKPVGDVAHCDWEAVAESVLSILRAPPLAEYGRALGRLRSRLDSASSEFAAVLRSIS